MASVKSEFSQLTPETNAETLTKTSVKRQFFAVICLDLLAFSYGATCGWSSPSIPLLKSEETPLDTGPISIEEASWIVALQCVGGFAGNLVLGWVRRCLKIKRHHLWTHPKETIFHLIFLRQLKLSFMGFPFISQLVNRVGQKNSLFVVALPQVLSWLFIYYARTPFYLIVSRLLGGFSGGGFYAIAPSYISEISDNKVRGTLGSTVVFSCNIGIFWACVCGEYVEYSTTPWLMIPGRQRKFKEKKITHIKKLQSRINNLN